MKELILNKTIENEVEGMFALVSQVANIKKDYPVCWEVLAKEFQLFPYQSGFIGDEAENIKIRLYAEIVRQISINEKTKADKVAKELKK